VDPGAFEALTTGRVLLFERDGSTVGIEQYLPGRRVLWQYADGTCTRGFWFADGPQICFVYDTAPAPQCWLFERRGARYYARQSDLASGHPSEILMSRELPAPPTCQGPGLGV